MGVVAIRATPGHQPRPGRRPVVVADLGSLTGPTTGVVQLPHRLLWRADRRVDLDQPWQLRLMYEAVLAEAVRQAEVTAWLEAATLVLVWPELYLPRGVRLAWEQRHPVLAGVLAAA